MNADINSSAAIAYSKLNLNNSIVAGDLTTDSVTSAKILDNTIVSADLSSTGGSEAVATANIQGLAVTTAKLANGAVTTAKLDSTAGSEAVTTSVIRDSAVTSAKIADGTIVDADISASAAIAYSKLNLANSIVNNDVAAGAAIAYSKLNLTNSIVNGDLTTDAVHTANIQDGAVTTAKLASGAIPTVVGGTVLNAPPNAISTNYFGMFGSFYSAQSAVQQPLPTSGTISNFTVNLAVAPNNGGGTQSFTFTVMNGGSATAVGCTISETATDCSDSSNTASFSSGDLISIREVPAGTPTIASNLARWVARLSTP